MLINVATLINFHFCKIVYCMIIPNTSNDLLMDIIWIAESCIFFFYNSAAKTFDLSRVLMQKYKCFSGKYI